MLAVTLSGSTQAQGLQSNIESKLTTRKKRGIYGPEERKQRLIVFVDDLNMPQADVFGAQAPLEVLRQWLDCGALYDN